MVRLHAKVPWCEAEGHRHLEFFEGAHLPVESPQAPQGESYPPSSGQCADNAPPSGAATVPPHRDSGPGEGEPLANAQVRWVFSEEVGRPLWRAVGAQQAHMEVPVVRRPPPPPCGVSSPPGVREVVEAVPVDPRRAPDRELCGAGEPELLDLLSAEAGDTDL